MMNTWTLALLLIVVYIIYRHLKKKLQFFQDKGIPCVAGWPLLGNMSAPFFRRQHISQTVVELYNAYPEAKYVGVFDFMQPVFMLCDPELIKSVTIKNFESFPDRWSFVDHELDPFFGGNLLTMTGERWKQARNLLTPAFTSRKIKATHEIIAERARIVVDYLSNLPDKRMLDMRDFFTRYATDVIAACAFGLNVDSVRDPKNDFYVIGTDAANLSGIMTIKFFIARSFPNLVRRLNIKFFDERVVNFFESIISKTVNARDGEGVVRPDMIQLMMNARTSHKLDVPEMTAHAFMFFFGGFDSTATQLCIMAHELAINPDVQKRLQDEIDEVTERRNGKPTYEDVQGMLYLDAVFNESMRKHPQAAALDRICAKRFKLPPAMPGSDSIVIEPGTRIWIPAAAIHKDPEYFNESKKFEPDRYFEKKVTVNEVTNLGFGIGPRSCIGYRFALLEIKILFVYLLSEFNLVPNTKTCKPLRYCKSSLSVSAEGGFWLEIERRS